MKTTIAKPLALLAAIATIGCSDTAGPAFELSRTELLGLAGEIQNVLASSAPAGIRNSAPMAALIAFPQPRAFIQDTFKLAATCPSGGSATVLIISNFNPNTMTTVEVTYSFTACRTAHYSVDGAFTLNASYESANGPFTNGQGNYDGHVVVKTPDGRSGDCGIGISVVETSSGGITLDGAACGVNVAGSYTL